MVEIRRDLMIDLLALVVELEHAQAGDLVRLEAAHEYENGQSCALEGGRRSRGAY
jgi:hypothetical protein